MMSFKKLYQEIRLRDMKDLSARIARLVDAATGSYKRRIPSHELTAAEFIKVLKYGAAETPEEFLGEHDALPFAFQDVPIDIIPETVFRQAEKAAGQRLEFPGGEHYFQDQIDWHHALNKNTSWPHGHWSEIPFRSIISPGDIKSCWEMNRHQFFPALALAHIKTGNLECVETLKKFIHSWCDQNTPETGVNYISNLEIGLRCIAWIYTDKILKAAPAYDAATKMRLHANIYSQARHIAEYLSYTEKTGRNNHLIGDAAALAFIALHYPEFQESEKWLARALETLWSTLDEQVFPDGMHFEGSFGYHLFVTEFLLMLFAELRRHKKPIPAKCHKLPEKMVTVLLAAGMPNGDLPNINDNDNGCVLPLPASTAARISGALATAAVLYNRPDFKAAGEYNLYAWLILGEKGAEEYRIIPEYPEIYPVLTHLKESGIVMMQKDGDFCLLKNNPDPFPASGHNHADLLNVLLMFDGKNILVDSGTYRYTGDGGFRNALRSTAAHNTITVDGKGQAEPHRAFGWTSLTKALRTDSFEQGDICTADGEHASYEHLGVTHRRAVIWLQGENVFIIIDKMTGDDAHHFRQFWHFPAEMTFEDAGHHHYRLKKNGEPVAHLLFLRENDHDRQEILSGSERNKTGHVSKRYGLIEPATTLQHSWSTSLSPEHASHRIVVISKTECDPRFRDVSPGVFEVCGLLIDMTETPVKISV